MINKPKKELQLKVTIFVVALTVVSLIHWGIWLGLSSAPTLDMPTEVFRMGQFRVALNPIFFDGQAFGAQQDHPTGWLAVKGVSVIIFILFFVASWILVPTRYIRQLVAVALIGAAGLARGVENVSGGQRVYFDVAFGSWQVPVFSFYNLVMSCAVIFLYLGVAAVFFRNPQFGIAKVDPDDSVPTIHDPLYEKRKPLKILLVLMFLIGMLQVLSAGVKTWDGFQTWNPFQQGEPPHVIFLTVSGVLLVGSMAKLLPIALLWRLIPARSIDVLYLRAFYSDKSIWSLARLLRRHLSPKLRIAGFVNPKEVSSWYQLPYWLVAPFMFALGDFARINVTRHNLFLEGDWRDCIEAAFANARAAVFDCRNMTKNLAWEIEACARILGPDRMLFIMPAGVKSGVSTLWPEIPFEVVEAIPRENLVSSADIELLAAKVRDIAV